MATVLRFEWIVTRIPTENMMSEVKLIETKIVYRNHWMTVREDKIQRESGASGLYGVVEKPDFTVILPIENNDIFVVEQYRYPVGNRWLELPQGSWNGEEEKSIEEVAFMELSEETGIEAKRLIHIGEQFVAYGYSNQKYHIFVAKDFTFGTPKLETEEEGLVSRKLRINVFEKMIVDGQIQDSATVTAFLLAKLKGYI